MSLILKSESDHSDQDLDHSPSTNAQALNRPRTDEGVEQSQDFVKRKARDILMSRSCAVYGSDKPRNAPRRSKSLLTLVLEEINAQNNQFKRDYLPRGYIDGELAALGSVDRFLLTNIQGAASRENLLPVPTISALLVQMRTSFTPPIPGALVLSYDHAMFGQDLWSEMDAASIALPTEEQISARMESNASGKEPAFQDDAANA
ncbi:hypothetical protein PtA15_3A876 [Puccinia triticina]|uniref:Uncharacterized protein n=1 Tax=Puccinia triticina TaxID=208348 RepID=A0ABY7CFG2_9BASI|nr:uncharacterized protein PtA15_3A876 [Puccinia triticina]WAQ83505.1 hypothetical protein PtA15_3A876 [Puccinia triticina]